MLMACAVLPGLKLQIGLDSAESAQLLDTTKVQPPGFLFDLHPLADENLDRRRFRNGGLSNHQIYSKAA